MEYFAGLDVSMEETAICVIAERAVMAAVDGNCRTPVAAFAEKKGDRIHLRALLAEPDGSDVRTCEREAAWPKDEAEAARLGRDAGEELVRRRAAKA